MEAYLARMISNSVLKAPVIYLLTDGGVAKNVDIRKAITGITFKGVDDQWETEEGNGDDEVK